MTAAHLLQAAGLLMLAVIFDQIVPGVLILASVAGAVGLLVAAAGKRVHR